MFKIKPHIKNGFVYFKNDGTLEPAKIQFHPSGVVTVHWLQEVLRSSPGDGPEYPIEPNKYGITSFLSTEA